MTKHVTQLLLGCSVLLLAGQVAWGQTARQPRIVEFTRQGGPAVPAVRESHYAILGEVKFPGVYRTIQTATLGHLLQQAGGASDRAGSGVRLVRRGRPGQRLLLPQALAMPLEANDVLVVDLGNEMPANAAASMANGPGNSDAGTYVALLDVLHRPVVVRVHPNQATIPALVQMLGQPATAMSALRVIEADRRTQLQQPSPYLPSGAVLAFDRRWLRAEQLPAFPNVIDLPAAAAVAPAPTPLAEPPRSSVQLPQAWPQQGPFVEPLNLPAPSMLPTPDPLAGLSQMTVQTQPPQMGPATFATNPQQTNDGMLNARSASVSPNWLNEESPAAPSDRRVNEPTPIDSDDFGPAPEEPVVKASPASSTPARGAMTFQQMMTIVSIVTGLVGAALVVRHVTEEPAAGPLGLARGAGMDMPSTNESARRLVPMPTETSTTMLENLIARRMPLVEEECFMPSGLRFHAQSAVERVVRVDVAEPVMNERPAPHFARRPAMSKGAAEKLLNDGPDMALANDGWPQSTSMGTVAASPELHTALDRALTRIQSGDRR